MPAIRSTYLSDYGITERKVKNLLEYCKSAGKSQQDIILKAAQISNEDIAIPLFINLTSGVGYDRISKWYEIPMQRKDEYSGTFSITSPAIGNHYSG